MKNEVKKLGVDRMGIRSKRRIGVAQSLGMVFVTESSAAKQALFENTISSLEGLLVVFG